MVDDVQFMQRALFLAERGRGRTSPNPMVGAVVVSPDGVVVGSGFHEIAGGPHAEIVALHAAGERTRGATLYCTLEPCCHLGRTGPCTARICAAGIARVVAAVGDPNPRVAGGGFRELRAHGIEVREGVCASDAVRLNTAFFTWVRTGRPQVTAKVAVTLDNRVAAGEEQRTPITSAEANRAVHLDRAAFDAIAVGSGTLLADDPLLTARGAWRARPLVRVVFDRSLRTPPSARLFSTSSAGPVIIMSTAADIAARPERVRALERAGAEVEAMPGDQLTGGLERLGHRGVTSLLVEGGPGLHRAFWQSRLIDALQLYLAPVTAGERGVRWLDAGELRLPIGRSRARCLGPDVRVDVDVHGTD
ncbi:MAG TPA: bifunctional diaminohydroxyphosphoribosylaminopyrimidine deaminase/5-amino-6-(5-phosphoribosylamino)uracil reductase RibD [Vicinamibacterales bacterium]|nr:bifunctional diaminohydroxyphosphoribosylaminopyrimidine deaminase/5-amino-6-(5-phosphoribosylamino)uracil reductase RibD [Vicinamibacterales bacterium]